MTDSTEIEIIDPTPTPAVKLRKLICAGAFTLLLGMVFVAPEEIFGPGKGAEFILWAIMLIAVLVWGFFEARDQNRRTNLKWDLEDQQIKF